MTPIVQPQGGRLVNMSLPAGQTVRAMSSGTQAYLVVATAPVNMRPLGGDFTTFNQGTGIATRTPFQYVELNNFQSYPVVVSLWVGWDTFIDKRLIVNNASQPNIAFPTYPTPNTALFINIVDLSGGAFTDINGNLWLALYRQSILISNFSSGTYNLGGYSPIGASTGTSIGIIPPAPTPVRYDVSGNFTIQTGGTPVNMVVSEIYSCIAGTV